ncbi:hypothetical protein BC628DRAFT_32618 [Trametes gibbosa]|nr:hypothetical protein BC628DRAFT_32618 [Trametes gibbosa]
MPSASRPDLTLASASILRSACPDPSCPRLDPPRPLYLYIRPRCLSNTVEGRRAGSVPWRYELGAAPTGATHVLPVTHGQGRSSCITGADDASMHPCQHASLSTSRDPLPSRTPYSPASCSFGRRYKKPISQHQHHHHHHHEDCSLVTRVPPSRSVPRAPTW